MAQLDPWFVVMCSRHGHNCETGPCPGCSVESHETDAATRRADYNSGRWCGECRHGVVEDPPCCWVPEPHAQRGDDG